LSIIKIRPLFFSAIRSGFSAREIHRQLGVADKCAWLTAHQIRSLIGNNLHVKFTGNVEIDDTYIGGKGERGGGAEKKTIILGILARKGNVKGEVVKNMKKKTITPIIKNNVTTGARISTDKFSSYRNLVKEGYFHDHVKPAVKEYVMGDCRIQSIEGF